MAANGTGLGSRLLYLHDRNNGRKFLIDTGAAASIYPASRALINRYSSSNPVNTDSIRLIAANGTEIRTFGKERIHVDLGVTKTSWPFVLADVNQPLIGADFLAANNLCVDLRGRRLINADTWNSVTVQNHEAPSSVSTVSQCPYKQVLETEFKSLLTPSFKAKDIKHQVEHHVTTKGPPVHAKPRRLDSTKLKAAEKEFRMMEELGIVRRSNSPWSSPLHMVRKPDGSWRPCGDFRKLNAATIPDRYPIPHVQDLTARLHGTRIFTKLDLVKGFFHIPVAEEDIKKTAIATPFGLFEFLRMPFGLCNAAQSFQRFMDVVLQDLDGVFVYIDDILIATPDAVSHISLLRKVCQRLSQHGLAVNYAKCEFGRSEMDFLGHTVDQTGIRPTSAKVNDILNFPKPVTRDNLSTFLGMVNYYHRFIPNASAALAPLHDAVTNASTSKTEIKWTETLTDAFDAARHALANSAHLFHPDPRATTAIKVDASDTAMGAALEQWINNAWRPLAFVSRKLDKAQRNYSTFDKELLAMYTAVQKFRHFIEGRPFVIFTDHKPLTYAMSSNTEYSPRQRRHLSYISEFTTDIRHISGKENTVADALSRPTISTTTFVQTVDEVELANEQLTDPGIRASRTACTSLKLDDIPIPNSTLKLLCDVSGPRPRPLVPLRLRQKIFQQLHGLAHPGVRATRQLISQRFVWHGMAKDIATFCRECHGCSSSKVQRHNRSVLSQFPQPTARLQHVHVDIVGPLPASKGKRYLLTAIDRFTRWPVAMPLTKVTAEDCTDAFMSGWVAQYGCPETVSTDRGGQFISRRWKETMRVLATKPKTTTSYHPQSNGIVERFHRHLKAALKARGGDWVDDLPVVLLAIRTTPKFDLGASAAELLYGTTLRLPGDMVVGSSNGNLEPDRHIRQLRTCMKRLANVPPAYHGEPHVYLHPDLNNAKFVYVREDAVRAPLDRAYNGPFRVLATGEKTFLLEINNRADRVSVDRLKPAYGEPIGPGP